MIPVVVMDLSHGATMRKVLHLKAADFNFSSLQFPDEVKKQLLLM